MAIVTTVAAARFLVMVMTDGLLVMESGVLRAVEVGDKPGDTEGRSAL